MNEVLQDERGINGEYQKDDVLQNERGIKEE